MSLLLEMGAALITFLAILIVVSQHQSRQDQRRWQVSHEELHRVQGLRVDDLADRLERLERKVDRVIPVVKVDFKPPTGGSMEVKDLDEWP